MSNDRQVQRALRTQVNRRRAIQYSALGAGGAALGLGGRYRARAQDDVKRVTFSTPGGAGPFCSGFDEIALEFEAITPGVDIEPTICGAGEQSFNEFLLARIAAGDPPDGTIYWNSPVTLAVRDAIEPIDDLMASSRNSQVENWPPNVLASCQLNGVTYGLPITAGSYAMIYNEELFEAKGLPSGRADFPKTWDELRRFSKTITQWDGDTLVTAGMIPPRNNAEFPIWVGANGGSIFDAENLRYTLDSEPVVEFLNWCVEWLDDEYRGDILAVDESANWTENVVDGRPPEFQAGTLGMQGNGFWITGIFYTVEPAYTRWNVASYPVGPGGTSAVAGYYPNWMVFPKGAQYTAEAFAFGDFIAVEGMPTWFRNIPDTPSNTKVSTLVPTAVVERRGQEFADDITTFFDAQLDVSVPMWNSPVEDFALDQIGRALEQVYAKQLTPQEAMTEAQSACQAELDRVLAG